MKDANILTIIHWARLEWWKLFVNSKRDEGRREWTAVLVDLQDPTCAGALGSWNGRKACFFSFDSIQLSELTAQRSPTTNLSTCSIFYSRDCFYLWFAQMRLCATWFPKSDRIPKFLWSGLFWFNHRTPKDFAWQSSILSPSARWPELVYVYTWHDLFCWHV